MSAVTLKQAFDLAVQHHQSNRFQEAETIYRQILQQQPAHTAALSNLQIIATQYNNHAVDLYLNEQLDAAIAAWQKSLSINPNYPEALNNFGNALHDKGRLADAIAAYQMAIALRPNYANAFSNLGVSLREIGRVSESIAAHHHALSLDPNHADAHFNLSLSLLLSGDWTNGLVEREWRSKIPSLHQPRCFPQPRWTGQEIAGKSILLHFEQGLGDTMMCLRYIPLLTARGARVILQVQPELQTLCAQIPDITLLDPDAAAPLFDFHCPLMSLPLAFKTTPETIPAAVPYLRADPARLRIWQQKLADLPRRMKVALVWAGNPNQKNDRNRSMPFQFFSPLARMENVQLFSLQKGPTSSQFESLSVSPNTPLDFSSHLHDFADTAALLANMDLLISVNTSVAHLAGAMGKPVWALVCYCPDWRWLRDRSDTPWYPTMRLFRQAVPGDWASVVDRVTAELSAAAKAHT